MQILEGFTECHYFSPLLPASASSPLPSVAPPPLSSLQRPLPPPPRWRRRPQCHLPVEKNIVKQQKE